MLETFLNVSLGVKIEIMIVFFVELGPILYGFLRLKQFMKVGEIDYYQFIFLYGFAYIIIFYFILPIIFGITDSGPIVINLLGIFIGIPFGVLFFNVHNPEATLNFFLEIEMETRNVNLHSAYIYEKEDKLFIIEYDVFEKEAMTDFLKRMFGYKIEVIFTRPVNLIFSEHYKNRFYFVLKIEAKKLISWEYWEDENGKKYRTARKILGYIRKQSAKFVTPVKAQTYNEIDFLIHFRNYEEMNEKYTELYMKYIKLEKNVETKAIEYAKEMIELLEINFKKALVMRLQKKKAMEELKRKAKEKLKSQDQKLDEKEGKDLIDQLRQDLGDEIETEGEL